MASLLNEAWREATGAQGSQEDFGSLHSHFEIEDNSIAKEGSDQEEEDGSQKFHPINKSLVTRHFKERRAWTLVNDALSMLERSCRPRHMAGSREIFHSLFKSMLHQMIQQANFLKQDSEGSIVSMGSKAEDPLRRFLRPP